ncbi:MAG: hypothetical protein GY822_05250 [Deltaproteobacteria bacterium]|nr:hypothetical protein [Deltaproteobacteria bacterium]
MPVKSKITAPFIDIRLDRQLEADYDGDVFVWDIDKTYLQTHFSSLRGLLAIPIEFAVDKKAVPGAVPLLRALRRGPAEIPDVVPLFFASGSPPQLRRVVERKMNLDGVQFDGIAFKDQWGLVKAGRPKGVKEQVGYKLSALLMIRQNASANAKWHLFGDDVESDAEVFSLFGEVCAGLTDGPLERELEAHGVHAKDQAIVAELVDEQREMIGGENPVANIFIHLDRNTPPEQFANKKCNHDKVIPIHGFIQAALVLAQQEKIASDAVIAVASDTRRCRIPEDRVSFMLEDARSRLHIEDKFLRLARR